MNKRTPSCRSVYLYSLVLGRCSKHCCQFINSWCSAGLPRRTGCPLGSRRCSWASCLVCWWCVVHPTPYGTATTSPSLTAATSTKETSGRFRLQPPSTLRPQGLMVLVLSPVYICVFVFGNMDYKLSPRLLPCTVLIVSTRSEMRTRPSENNVFVSQLLELATLSVCVTQDSDKSFIFL